VPRPPLPDVPTLRCNLDYTQTDGFTGGGRFYISYSGSPPTAGNCATYAGDIAAAWLAQLAAIVNDDWALTEVDVLDIASYSGLRGFWTGSHSGSAGAAALPAQCAANCEFNISRTYRGGKPRMYLPPPVDGSLTTPSMYTSGFVSALSASVGDFFAAILGVTVGSTTTQNHINLSYYDGWDTSRPIVKPSGTRYPPKYRSPNAISDVVTGYAGKAQISSQRRRRAATTP